MPMSKLPSDRNHFLLFFRAPPPPQPTPFTFSRVGEVGDQALGKHDRRSRLQTAVENLSSSFWWVRSRVEKQEREVVWSWRGLGWKSSKFLP